MKALVQGTAFIKKIAELSDVKMLRLDIKGVIRSA